MEYTQWEGGFLQKVTIKTVLILVVMEYTQWVAATSLLTAGNSVLILVVMEYTQWEAETAKRNPIHRSLNPCCNGIYSMRNTR